MYKKNFSETLIKSRIKCDTSDGYKKMFCIVQFPYEEIAFFYFPKKCYLFAKQHPFIFLNKNFYYKKPAQLQEFRFFSFFLTDLGKVSEPLF